MPHVPTVWPGTKKLIVLKGWGHYEVYTGEAFRQVIEPTLAWYQTHLPPK